MDKKYRWYRFIPMTIVMGIIFFISHQPGDSLDLPDVPNLDKLMHMIAYGVLAVSILYAFSRKNFIAQPARVGAKIVLFCCLYGISDEFHQLFIPDRFVSVFDLLADGAGAVLAVTIMYYLLKTDKIPGCLFPFPEKK